MSRQDNTDGGFWQRLRSVSLVNVVILTVLCLSVVLTAELGFWQLRRADQKRQLLHALSVNHRQPASQQVDRLNHMRYRFTKLKLHGHFDASHAVWQSSQLHRHQLGYVIWVPFHVAGVAQAATPWVWVNVGWVPQGPDHQPQLPTWQPSTKVELHEGVVDVLPINKVPWIGSQAIANHWPVITVTPDWPTLNAQLHRRFYPLSWRLSAPSPKGWLREHTWVVMMPARHMAYAVQWFVLSLVLLLYGVWFVYKKGK